MPERGRRPVALYYLIMLRALGTALLIPVVLVGAAGPLAAQVSRSAIDFLDEKLQIPDSDRFDEAAYTESGVGLSFGVDQRLSYLAGRYGDAARRFEDAVTRFPHKSEIWVYLARSYFHMKTPDKALETLARAGVVLPDLNERLWEPLRQSLLGHVRHRAAVLQIQVDFYSGTPDQFLTLFRLYKFLNDEKAAGGVILAAEAKAEGMKGRAATVSPGNQTVYRNESLQWQGLADQLRAELTAAGVAPPAVVQQGLTQAEAQNAALVEQTRWLQLRVDFYQAAAAEYQALFDNYQALGQTARAGTVLERLDERILRLRWLAQAAATATDETGYLDEATALEELKEAMALQLPAPPAVDP